MSIRTGKPERAREELERALSLRPDEPPALIRLARVELERNRPERAETLFGRALELDAGSAATEQEVDRQRRTNRNLRVLVAGIGVLLIVAVGAVMAWVWDVSETAARTHDRFVVFPPLVTAAAAGALSYAYGFEGFAGSGH